MESRKTKSNIVDNNSNNDKDALKLLTEHFFSKVYDSFLKYVSEVFDLSSIENDYKEFSEYCANNPTILFDAINYIYPYIQYKGNDDEEEAEAEAEADDYNYDYDDDEEESDAVRYIKALKIGFEKNKVVKNILNKYSEDILLLLEDYDILDSVSKLFLYLLRKLLRYHNIYKDSYETKNWKYLMVKEYYHRKKINI